MQHQYQASPPTTVKKRCFLIQSPPDKVPYFFPLFEHRMKAPLSQGGDREAILP